MPLGLKFGLFKKVLDEFSFNFPPKKDLHNTEKGIDQEREKLISFFLSFSTFTLEVPADTKVLEALGRSINHYKLFLT